MSDVEQWSTEEGGVWILSDADLWVKATTVGSGRQCLCVVLIKIEIYALPAFMGLAHCGDAYSDLPPPLSRQAAREADIVNGSLCSYPTSSTLLPTVITVIDWWLSDLSCAYNARIYHEEVKM